MEGRSDRFDQGSCSRFAFVWFCLLVLFVGFVLFVGLVWFVGFVWFVGLDWFGFKNVQNHPPGIIDEFVLLLFLWFSGCMFQFWPVTTFLRSATLVYVPLSCLPLAKVRLVMH